MTLVAQYRLAKLNMDIGGKDFGKVEFSEGVGAQLTHARNKLDAFITNVEHSGDLNFENNHFKYGIKFTHEDIRDRIREYEIIDSAGFTVRPPLPDFKNNQPYEPYDAPLVPFTSVRGFNETEINRFQAFVQWSRRGTWGIMKCFIMPGVRSHTWRVNSQNVQTVFSPRGQLAIKPDWKQEMVFRLAAGLYHQPPFYRELRDFTGDLNPGVEAQRAIHFVMEMTTALPGLTGLLN